MSRLEALVQTLSRWAPTIGTAAIAAVLDALHQSIAAGAALLATALFAALALIDTNPRS